MRFWIHRRVRRVTVISIGSAAFLGGVGLVRIGLTASISVAIAGLLCFVLCRRRVALVAVPAVIMGGLLLGLWRGGVVDRQLDWYRQSVNQKVSLTGTVTQDCTYGAKKQMDCMIGNVRTGDHSLPGTVRVTTFSPVEPKQGDVIRATAKLKPGFGSYQAGLYFADVSVVSHGDSWLGQIRRHFSATILSIISEPQASLGLGFLLGIKSQLPDELVDQLKIVGLTHIVVASGYNLTILVRAARRLLVERSKYQATLASVLLMAGFLGATGFSPSMSRAALVTSLSLAAWYYGRVIHPVLLLLFSAAVTAAINPLYVWGDLGWYLSFLAFGGVMLLAPVVQNRLCGDHSPPQLVQILIETVCAEIATIPLVLFVFGGVSVIGLLANVLVTPLVPLAMLATFVAGAAAWAWPGFGSWLALPAQWLLNYMTYAVGELAAFPWAYQIVQINAPSMVALYALAVACGWAMYRASKYSYLNRGLVE